MANAGPPKPRWLQLCEEVSAETDGNKLTEMINRAEEAMMMRAEEISHNPDHLDERNAMAQAAENLLVIKTEKLSWPPIEKK
jgi:hypothetical protein